MTTKNNAARVAVQAEPCPTTFGHAGSESSLIVLSLRPEGAKFNGNRVERAQEAGFDWLKNVHLIGMSHPDTGEEIARHVVATNDEGFGRLKEIQVHIDPERCACMWRAGHYLMERLKKYAVLIGARICNSMGQPLNDEAIDAIGMHIDKVMEQRREADRKACIVTLPNGEVREVSELSFAYTVLREAGSKKKTYRQVHFNAPALHHFEGQTLGMQMAGEIVQFYLKHKEERLGIISSKGLSGLVMSLASIRDPKGAGGFPPSDRHQSIPCARANWSRGPWR
jgi:hypothetical protein